MSSTQALVDLEIIERQRLQVGEARIAGAEIVDRDPQPALPQPGEQVAGGAEILDQAAFGDLDGEPRRVEAGLARPAR